MFANLSQNNVESEAIEHGEFPNAVTFTNVLPACARTCSLRSGKEIHARLIRDGSVSDLFVSNALMDMYAKCGCLRVSRSVFVMSPRTDQISYNILIVGYSQTNECHNSLLLFSDMELLGLKHDSVSFTGVLSACAAMHLQLKGHFINNSLLRIHFWICMSNLDR